MIRDIDMLKEANVTVVIPCFNCSDTIGRAVASIYEQTFRPAEVVLVDDKSSDDTLSKLYALQKQYPNNWVKVIALECNSGPSGARNAGWDAASQEYIALLDSDDSWHPQKIEIQHAWMKANPSVVLTGHEISILSDETTKGARSKLVHEAFEMEDVVPSQFSKTRLLLRGNFSTSSVMLRREIKNRFARGQNYGEDRLLLLEVVCAGGLIYKLSPPLEYKFKETFGAGGLSAHVWRMEKGELETFRKIWRAGYISLPTFCLVCAWSLAKYVRRLIIVALRGRACDR